MTNFDIRTQFDVATCLFSSIGYVRTLQRLRLAVRSMARHLKPEGLLIIEPWFTPENWHPNTVHALFIDDPELKIARVSTSFTENKVSVFDLHHLIGTPEGTEHVVEHHEMGLASTPAALLAECRASSRMAWRRAGARLRRGRMVDRPTHTKLHKNRCREIDC